MPRLCVWGTSVPTEARTVVRAWFSSLPSIHSDVCTGIFSPAGFPNGSIVYDFVDSHAPAAHRALLPFEMYRETLVVFALTDGREYIDNVTEESLADALQQAVGEFAQCIMNLQDRYDSSLVQRLLLFDFDAEEVKLPSNTVKIPSPGKSVSTTALKTAMADVTAALLEELSALSRSIQALPLVDTPRAVILADGDLAGSGQRSLLPGSRHSMILESGKSSPAPTDPALKANHRMSMPPHLSGSDMMSRGSQQRPLSGTSTPPSSFDEIAGSSTPPSTATTDNTSRPAERISLQGFGSGSAGEKARNQAQNRLGTIKGSLYLLAGRWVEAAKELNAGATSAKANSDYAWYAKSLDLLFVALLMQAWANIDFEVCLQAFVIQMFHPLRTAIDPFDLLSRWRPTPRVPRKEAEECHDKWRKVRERLAAGGRRQRLYYAPRAQSIDFGACE